MASSPTAVAATGSLLRVIAQGVTSATLLVDNVSKTISIGQGVVLYVAFVGAGIQNATIDNAVASLIQGKIFTFAPPPSPTGDEARPKPSAVLDAGVDVLVVPQATLGGKMKGKNVQYHAQAPKDEAAALYQRLNDQLRKQLLPPELLSQLDVNGVVIAPPESSDQPPAASSTRRVYCGTYGNRQALQLDSTGPMTHCFEFTN